MTFEVVLAEKNELAEDAYTHIYPFCKPLGSGHYVSDNVVIISTNGHLRKLVEPDGYDIRYKKWNKEDLPLCLRPIKKEPIPGKENRHQQVIQYLKKATKVIHLGDPDDEGQLICDEMMDAANYTGQVDRVYLTSRTESHVKQRFSQAVDNKTCIRDGYAAFARSVGDLWYGVNLSRVNTISAQEAGYDVKLNVGRVKNAIIGLVVRRDREFESHKKSYYYDVFGTFSVNGLSFNAKYITTNTDPIDDKNRIIDKGYANGIVNNISGAQATILSATTELKEVSPPLPWNLATLSSAAAKKFKLKPDQIMKITQDLRMKHKLITYNRSDVQYLDDTHFQQAPMVLASVAKNSSELAKLVNKANPKIKSRAFNSKYVKVHHGIIPTETVADLSVLTSDELNIYNLVCTLYIAQFYPKYKFNQTDILVGVDGYKFKKSSKKDVELGWKEIFVDSSSDEDDEESNDEFSGASLADLRTNMNGNCIKGIVEDKETKPRPRYTFDTLMKDMNNIAKYCKDEKIKNLFLEKDKDNPAAHGSIGTAATQGPILKELFEIGYFKDEKSKIISTQLCRDFFDSQPEDATMPDMTALWFEKQKMIAEGKYTVEEFLKEVEDHIVREVARVKESGVSLNIKVERCPKCENPLKRNKSQHGFYWYCSNYKNGCKDTYKDEKGKPVLEVKKPKLTGRQCPECNKDIVERSGKHGPFNCCSGYPECKYIERTGLEITGRKCPQCGKDTVIRDGKFGKFECCSGYPECKHIVKEEKPIANTTGEKCPQCNSDIVERDGLHGKWKSCSNYPKCKWTPPKKVLEETGEICPKCNSPMVRRTSKDGTKVFLGCSAFPKCNHIEW